MRAEMYSTGPLRKCRLMVVEDRMVVVGWQSLIQKTPEGFL